MHVYVLMWAAHQVRLKNSGRLTCCTAGRRETVRLIRRLHQYDVMRANKAPFAFGLEPRVPFLDKEFLDVSMTLDPADKMVRLCQIPQALPCLPNCASKSVAMVLMPLPHQACL